MTSNALLPEANLDSKWKKSVHGQVHNWLRTCARMFNHITLNFSSHFILIEIDFACYQSKIFDEQRSTFSKAIYIIPFRPKWVVLFNSWFLFCLSCEIITKLIDLVGWYLWLCVSVEVLDFINLATWHLPFDWTSQTYMRREKTTTTTRELRTFLRLSIQIGVQSTHALSWIQRRNIN